MMLFDILLLLKVGKITKLSCVSSCLSNCDYLNLQETHQLGSWRQVNKSGVSVIRVETAFFCLVMLACTTILKLHCDMSA